MAKGRQSGMPEEAYWNSFFDPDCVLAKLECDERCRDIVEFGCGYGLFTKAAASVVTGTVYALDIDPEMIAATRHTVTAAGYANVQLEMRDFVTHGCGRPDESMDYALLFNILHIEEPKALLREAFRALAPGGKAGIIHWIYDARTPRGPTLDIRPRPEQCQAWAEQAGFVLRRHQPLPCSPYHYGLIIEKRA